MSGVLIVKKFDSQVKSIALKGMEELLIILFCLSFLNKAYAVRCNDLFTSSSNLDVSDFITNFSPDISHSISRNEVYVNRWGLGGEKDISLFFERLVSLVESRTNRKVLILDFNFGQKSEYLNIISNNNILNSKKYQELSRKEKDKIFKSFFQKGERNSLLIIDHHFQINTLSDTSSTPLIVDFLLWAYRKQETTNSPILQSRIRNFLIAIQNSFIVRDHSDADIVLASLVARKATDASFVKYYGELLKNIAIFNDHGLVMSSTNSLKMLVGYYLFRGFENYQIREPDQAFQVLEKNISKIMAWIGSVSRGRASIKNVLSTVKHDFSLEARLFREGFDVGFQAHQIMSHLNDNIIANKLGAVALEPGTFSIVNNSLIVSLPKNTQIDAFQILLYLRNNRAEILDGAKTLNVISRVEIDGKLVSNLKVRSLIQGVDLMILFNHLRQAGFEAAGGRSTAGSVLGKSGQSDVSTSQLTSILEIITAL